MTFTPTRRRFLQTSSAAGAALAAGMGPAAAKPLPFRYGYSAISWGTNIEEAIKVGHRVGLPGIEPFRENVVNYLDKPLALKKLMDDAGIRMVSCSNGGGPDFSGASRNDQLPLRTSSVLVAEAASQPSRFNRS